MARRLVREGEIKEAAARRVLAKYAALVSSASEGAVTTGARMTANLRDRRG